MYVQRWTKVMGLACFSARVPLILASRSLAFLPCSASPPTGLSAASRSSAALRTSSGIGYSMSSLSDQGCVEVDSPPELVFALRDHLANGKISLILASQSPRRQEILDMMGLHGLFSVTPSPLDESALQLELAQRHPSVQPKEYVRILAEEKAKALAFQRCQHQMNPADQIPTLVLGSDTIVELDEVILEKPKDDFDAKQMLSRLSGREHHVHTGVAIVRILPATTRNASSNDSDDEPSSVSLIASFVDTASVRFTTLSEADIDAYIATREPMDKAGSYGIQGIGGQLVESITGDFFTVMGLPMHRVSRELARAVKDTVSAMVDNAPF